MKRFLLFFIFCLFYSCKFDVVEHKPNLPSQPNQQNPEEENKKIITDFYAQGLDSAIKIKWSPIPEEYNASISYVDNKTSENKNIQIEKNQNSFLIENLENATKEKSNVHKFTLTLKDKTDKVIETQTACATPASSYWEFEQESLKDTVWMFLLKPDSKIPQDEDYSKVEIESRLLTEAFIGKIKGTGLNSVYPSIYNNTESVTAIVNHGTVVNSDKFKDTFYSKINDWEEIQWFTTVKTGQRIEVYGKIVNPLVEENGYTEVSEFNIDTAEQIKNIDKAFRVGTKIITKGFFSVGDGGDATYIISNRQNWKYGSIKTATNQFCNIQINDNYLNLISLGAGKCFQVTKANIEEWENYKTQNYEQGLNDDADRITEAISILSNSRKTENETITLFIPKGNYRIGSTIKILQKNFILKGETIRRDITPEQIESFESTFALGNEIGSANFNGTVLYTDNGSKFDGFNIFGPANNVVIEGITLEARETDSKKTFWHSESDSIHGPYTDINYEGRGTCEYTQADQQWYSRQVMISECSNVTIRNCEFIITSHIRDEAVYTNGDEYKYNSDGTIFKYKTNDYVEDCDLHTDKQFTSITFFDSWKNVTVDDCLIYNMSGVFRGTSFGFLNMYGGQSNNGTLSNSTLYHNCHDEQIGIFTLTPNAGNYKTTQYIDGVNIVNNKIYPMRDEHVDKIKPRVMVVSVGYDTAKNIKNVNISKNKIDAENLPSKLFTFGGWVTDGRENIIVSENTINMKNSGGVYMFETRPYVEIKNNVINLDSDNNRIGGSIFDCTSWDESIQPKFINNIVNVNCDYLGSISHNGNTLTNGIVNNNTINIKGNQSEYLFNSNSEYKNNKITINGRMKTIFNIDSSHKLTKNILIEENLLTYNFNDSSDDYSLSQSEGGFFHTGREGCTFVDFSANNKNNFSLIVNGNKIIAPNCTTKNKHLLRYTKTTLPVFILNNKLEKLFYLRSESQSDFEKIEFTNNTKLNGEQLKKDDWCFANLINDTE